MNRIALLPAFILLLFLSCEKSDPCDGVQCQNGGVCASGDCDCPPGFWGSRCENEQKPIYMIINTVFVKKFPELDSSGNQWDFFDGPDLYLVIKDGPIEWYRSNVYENTMSGNNQLFVPDLIADPDRILKFELWDYDTGVYAPSDFIGSVQSTIYRAGEKFPLFFIVGCDDCSITIEISVSYFF